MDDSTTMNRHDQLVGTDWLERHLEDPDLLIFDCTVYLKPRDGGGFDIVSGREKWSEAHIPGSGFLDLIEDLSDRESELNFTFPGAEQFSAIMSRHGVGDGARVVLYDQTITAWATRVWWMLRAHGFDNASVLDGGWRKWQREGRPESTGQPDHPARTFTSRPRPGLFVGKDDVLASLDTDSTCIVSALGAQSYQARRIPTSINVPMNDLLDPQTNAYLPLDTIRQKFADAGALDRRRIITQCGGGIAATSEAFLLTLLGVENVAVYDGSMTEWSADPALPTEGA